MVTPPPRFFSPNARSLSPFDLRLTHGTANFEGEAKRSMGASRDWQRPSCLRAWSDDSKGVISLVECANLVVWFESVAQLVEHRPFKALVPGSSPSALTIKHL